MNGKSQILQVPRMPMPFKVWRPSSLWHVILWSIKTIKIGLTLSFQYVESTLGSNTSPVLLSMIVSPPMTIYLRSPSHANFLIVSSISFWSYIIWSITYCFRSSSRHAIHVVVSEPKIISLYLVMMSLIASSSSSLVFMQSRRGIINFFASSNSDVLLIYYWFCNPRQVTKIF